MNKVTKLVKVFKLSGLLETEKIELDNLDWAKLVYNKEANEVEVENEHGSFFDVGNLSYLEMDIFIANIPTPILTLEALKEAYINRCIDENKVDDYEQLVDEINESLDFDDFISVISLWSHEDIDIRFNEVFGEDTKYFKENLVVK